MKGTRSLLILLFLVSELCLAAQRPSVQSFHITPLKPVPELRREALAAKPPSQPHTLRKPDLVEVNKLDSSIKLDIRYATANNFMGTPFYEQARAFLQRPVARALASVNRKLRPWGYGLLVHDAYRPWYVTKMFWDATPADKKSYVADPKAGSNHNRGCAVDVSLYDLNRGQEVAMPSGYDEMSGRAHTDFRGGTPEQRRRRDLLQREMKSKGFRSINNEWWHFDSKDCAMYPVMNTRFEQIPEQPSAQPPGRR